jgi:hypothetical protein
MMTARSKSCKAPETISEADALFPSTIIASGISVSIGSFEVL